jgi:hypothetical protein
MGDEDRVDAAETPLSDNALADVFRRDAFAESDSGETGAQELVDHGHERDTPAKTTSGDGAEESAPPKAAAPVEAPAKPVAQPKGEAATAEAVADATKVKPEPKPGDPPPPIEEIIPKTPEVSPEMKMMQQTMQQLQTQNQLLMQQLQASAVQSQSGQAAQGPAPDPLPYNVVIPDQLWAALDSDDAGQRRQGIATLSTALARMVHSTMMPIIDQKLEKTVSQYGQTSQQEMYQQQEIQRQQSYVEQDFYGRYPQFGAPGLRNLVHSIGTQAMKDLGATQWSPQLRDYIAAKVQQTLAGAAPAPPETGNGVKPPQTRIPGARPPMVGDARGQDIGQEVRDLMELF